MQPHTTDSLVQWMLERLSARPRPWVVALAGFPATGKSTVADRLRAALDPGAAVILRTSSCTMPRHARRAAGISASSIEAVDMEAYRALAEQLVDGREVSIPIYSHAWASTETATVQARLPKSGCLILDGECAATQQVGVERDLGLFFLPKDMTRWLWFADRRDRLYRGYGVGPDGPVNVQRREDMTLVYQASRATLTHRVIATILGDEDTPVLSYHVWM